jgi:hypothetical protein
LLSDRTASINSHYLEVFGEFADFIGNLEGQLSGGTKDQEFRVFDFCGAATFPVEPLEDRQGIGESLS